MKKTMLKSGLLLLAAFALMNFSTALSQTIFHSSSVDIKLEGTSTLHDWHMKSAQGNIEVAFVLDENKVTSLQKLNLVLPAKSLKSESNAMDNNTYKALQASTHPNITFVLSSATVTPIGGNDYRINCVGKLTIAGTTQETDLVATARYNPADKSFTINGIKKMKMTEYNVKPPSVMLGTIKTGNDITISYNVRFTK